MTKLIAGLPYCDQNQLRSLDCCMWMDQIKLHNINLYGALVTDLLKVDYNELS
jgi:hypothetical protein